MDVQSVFTRTIDQIIAAQPDAVVFTGDLFDGGRPTNYSIGFAVRELRRLKEGVTGPVIVLAGNHDAPLRLRESGHPFEVIRRVEGIHCIYRGAELLEFPDLDLSIFAFPDAALRVMDENLDYVIPDLSVRGAGRYRVLLLHAGIRGVGQYDRALAAVPPSALPPEWDYIGAGDYHVAHQVRANAWYSGALDYVSSNPWGELKEEVAHGVSGKGWLLADLEAGTVTFHGPVNERPVIDLPAIEGYGLTAEEVTARILSSVATIEGGIVDKVVRQVVKDVPRETERLMDHKALTRMKGQALFFRLDIRRPAVAAVVGALNVPEEPAEPEEDLWYEPTCGNEPTEVPDDPADFSGDPFAIVADLIPSSIVRCEMIELPVKKRSDPEDGYTRPTLPPLIEQAAAVHRGRLQRGPDRPAVPRQGVGRDSG